MAVILLIEDQPDIGTYEARVLEAAGHRVIRCIGGPSLFGACPMLKRGQCSLVDSAAMIVFSLPMFSMRGRTYRGEHLLRAYRSHPDYSRLPMLIVSLGTPANLPGTGPIERVDKYANPNAVLEAVARLLPPAGQADPGVAVRRARYAAASARRVTSSFDKIADT